MAAGLNQPMRLRYRMIAASGALTVFAIASILSGLDRATEYRPAMAQLVPEPFQVHSAREIAQRELAEGRPELATASARRSVLRDPADARSIGLYGAALQLSGKSPEARTAFSVAGRMGWREPLTQLYWMSVAFDEGNFRIASQRLDAVLRQAPEYPGHAEMLAMLEAYPEGRDQLARRLAEAPAWLGHYFARSYEVPLSSQIMRADVARRLAQGQGVRSCGLVAPLAKSLVGSQDYTTAHLVWQVHCRHSQDSPFLADGGFSQATQSAQLTDFDWTWSDDGAVGLDIAPRNGFSGPALTVDSSSPREIGFASQMTILPAGNYTATWRARDSSGNPSGDIALSVSCDKNMPQSRKGTLRDSRAAVWEASFSVPADCPAQWFSLRIAAGTRTATVDDIAISRR